MKRSKVNAPIYPRRTSKTKPLIGAHNEYIVSIWFDCMLQMGAAAVAYRWFVNKNLKHSGLNAKENVNKINGKHTISFNECAFMYVFHSRLRMSMRNECYIRKKHSEPSTRSQRIANERKMNAGKLYNIFTRQIEYYLFTQSGYGSFVHSVS